MQLPIYRFLPYISPSTFLDWRRCQYKVYLTKLSGLTIPERVTGKPAALGLFFDSLLKEQIAKQKQIKTPFTSFTKVVNSTNIADKEEVVTDAKNLMKQYIDLGMLDRFLSYAKLDIYLEQEKYLQFPIRYKTTKQVKYITGVSEYFNSSIPILGRMDAIVDTIPFDWKVRGFYSNWTASPTAGYHYRIDSDGAEKTTNGVAADNVVYLDQKHFDWAVQLLFYNWLLNKSAKTSSYIIHEICKQKHKVVFTEHVGIISESFESQIIEELKLMWDMVYPETFSVDVPPPIPAKDTCEAYGSLCPVAIHCTKYQQTLGDPKEREKYV